MSIAEWAAAVAGEASGLQRAGGAAQKQVHSGGLLQQNPSHDDQEFQECERVGGFRQAQTTEGTLIIFKYLGYFKIERNKVLKVMWPERDQTFLNPKP